jgi:hypothetical protein
MAQNTKNVIMEHSCDFFINSHQEKPALRIYREMSLENVKNLSWLLWLFKNTKNVRTAKNVIIHAIG